MHGSVLAGTPAAAVVKRPADGAVADTHAGMVPGGVEHVVPTGVARYFTCHTVCSKVAVSTATAGSIRFGSSRYVTSRSHTSRYNRCGLPSAGNAGGFG